MTERKVKVRTTARKRKPAEPLVETRTTTTKTVYEPEQPKKVTDEEQEEGTEDA